MSITFGRARRIRPYRRRRHLKIAPFSVIIIIIKNNNNNNNNSNNSNSSNNGRPSHQPERIRIREARCESPRPCSSSVKHAISKWGCEKGAGVTESAEVTEETIQVRLRLDGILFILAWKKISVCGYNGRIMNRFTNSSLCSLSITRRTKHTLRIPA